MDKYICQCCGGKIDRETMTCEYCGTQYKKENDNVFRIEHCTLPVREVATCVNITDNYRMTHNEIMEIAIHRAATDLAKAIAPFCEYSAEHDPATASTNIRARIRFVPSAKGIGGLFFDMGI